MASTMQKPHESATSSVRYMLVEAEPEKQDKWKGKPSNNITAANFINYEGKSDGKRGRSKFIGKKSTRGGSTKNGKSFPTSDFGISYYDMPDAESRRMAAEYAVKQVEFYFSIHNLCSDVFLRSYMDCEGYIPIAFVANFPSVARLGADFSDILDGLRKSELLEIDELNETMRLKQGWNLWLLPNTSGTLGVARYIKVENAENISELQDSITDACLENKFEGQINNDAGSNEQEVLDEKRLNQLQELEYVVVNVDNSLKEGQ